MAGEAEISFVGNVGKEPELRITPTGKSVSTISVAVGSRKKVDGAWVDGDTSWYRVTSWGEDAEAITEKVNKGDRVVVIGTLAIGSYEKDGQKRLVPEVQATAIGVVPKAVPVTSKSKNDDDRSPW